ncbi:SLATT domain-containing protein [Burkholderia gladioli]|uniref:SLATT domain-containing protein n=1 Tax=Burkholderia gladioli TaxID=28095 RepID=UPI00163F9C5E|nr:SLATT domain-containing protein [Burkholderia gladioli]
MNDKIWFTYKARIRTHERLARNDFHSQTLLVWYAFSGAVLGIVAVRFPQVLGKNTDIISAVFSVALLAVSMLVTGRDFRGRSLEMQRNYLALQALYNKAKSTPPAISDDDLRLEYEHLLDSAENHTGIDDICARVFGAGELTSRIPTRREEAQACGYMALRFFVLFLFYCLPIAMAVFSLVH